MYIAQIKYLKYMICLKLYSPIIKLFFLEFAKVQLKIYNTEDTTNIEFSIKIKIMFPIFISIVEQR